MFGLPTAAGDCAETELGTASPMATSASTATIHRPGWFSPNILILLSPRRTTLLFTVSPRTALPVEVDADRGVASDGQRAHVLAATPTSPVDEGRVQIRSGRERHGGSGR